MMSVQFHRNVMHVFVKDHQKEQSHPGSQRANGGRKGGMKPSEVGGL